VSDLPGEGIVVRKANHRAGLFRWAAFTMRSGIARSALITTARSRVWCSWPSDELQLRRRRQSHNFTLERDLRLSAIQQADQYG